jgi:hypothetical protein
LWPETRAIRVVAECHSTPGTDAHWTRRFVFFHALEDAGCVDARLLGHLRNHDGRLRDCWVVAGLLGRA